MFSFSFNILTIQSESKRQVWELVLLSCSNYHWQCFYRTNERVISVAPHWNKVQTNFFFLSFFKIYTMPFPVVWSIVSSARMGGIVQNLKFVGAEWSLSGGVSAIIYYCVNVLTCGWRLTGLCLSSGRLTGLFLCSVYLNGVVWFGAFGGGGGGCFFLFSFFMSLNLSSKVWHLLHNSSFCPSWYSLTAVKSCTCSNFCWWTRSVRDGLNVAVFELMV